MKNTNIKKILSILSDKNIAIIGHMGSGKSAFSRKVALYLNIQHVDTDREIVKFGMSIGNKGRDTQEVSFGQGFRVVTIEQI